MVRLLKKVISVWLEVFKAGHNLSGYKKGNVTHDGNCGIHSLQFCVNSREDQDQAREIRAYLKSLFNKDVYDGQSEDIKQLIRAEIKEMVLSDGGQYCKEFKTQGSYQESVGQIAGLNWQMGIQQGNLITRIFGEIKSYAEIATKYSQWDRGFQFIAGSEPPAKKTRLEPGLKLLLYFSILF